MIPLLYSEGQDLSFVLTIYSSSKNISVVGQEKNWEIDERYISPDDSIPFGTRGNSTSCYTANEESDTEHVGLLRMHLLLSHAQNTLKDLHDKKDDLLEKLGKIYHQKG